MDPENCSRRILLAVNGLSPQVVTETVYALARAHPRALPTEIHVVTTAEGAERARLALLSRVPGWFDEKFGYQPDSHPGELYHLAEDLPQKNNLWADHPERVENMRKILGKIRGSGQVR